MKLNKIFLLSLLVLLLIGVSYATDINNDTITTTDTPEVVKDTGTTTNIIDNSITEETKKDKEITKQVNTNKTTKTSSKTYDVSDYNTLHNALTNGTYNTVTLNINSDITLSGNTKLNESIKTLIINGNGQTINGNDKYQFLNIGFYRCSVNISNLKITNCNGGAIYIQNGNLTITNTTFSNNIAKDVGGAIACFADGIYSDEEGNLIIYNSIFNNNTAKEYGGAIFNYNVESSIYNSTFSSNKAEYSGGAIYYDSGTLIIYNSIFNNNTASTAGAIYYEFRIL